MYSSPNEIHNAIISVFAILIIINIIILMIKDHKAIENSADIKQREFYFQVLGDNPINMDPEIFPRKNSINSKNFPSDDQIFQGHSKIQEKQIQEQKRDCGIKLIKQSRLNNSTLPQSQKSFEENNVYLNVSKQIRDTKVEQQESSSLSKKVCHRYRKSYSKFIFKEKFIKKITKKFAIPKFLVRLFLKYHKQYEISQEVKDHNAQIQQELLNFNENSFNLQRDAMKFLNCKQPNIGSKNRAIMWKILANKIRQEVILNSATQNNRISYLIGSKIYALRCRSKQLCKKANFR